MRMLTGWRKRRSDSATVEAFTNYLRGLGNAADPGSYPNGNGRYPWPGGREVA